MNDFPKAWERRRGEVIQSSQGDLDFFRIKVAQFSDDIDRALDSDEVDSRQWSEMKFTCSSLLINVGENRGERQLVEGGIECAELVLDRCAFPEINSNLKYNIANGLLALHVLGRSEWCVENPESPPGLFSIINRKDLRRARRLLADVGNSRREHPELRAMALCNLANELDHSGRWVEAYQSYVDALSLDPTNGNAAGNAAELLRIRVGRGRGLLGHYAAVYDEYVQQARMHRDRTVDIAGEDVARRWDDLPLSGSVGHVSHDGDPLDAYQQWIKDHRLALTVAVEGLGSDNPRWDDAMIRAVSVSEGEPDPPHIFASVNILKSEFMAARRLAYEGERKLNESEFVQHASDSGTYVDTLDMSLYGEPPAMLILAQRATLDLLDKIAVAANDHFKTGIKPGGVNFKGYWCDFGTGKIRDGLPTEGGSAFSGATIAFAELAFDIDPDGLYPDAKTLRNAGTHRLVRLTHGKPIGITDDAHSSVGMRTLIEATHQSLRVARSAYIYLLDLIEDHEDEIGKLGPRISLRIPDQK